MVLPLKPLQFYGSSLPRPRIYQDVKFNDHRVDPPSSVNDALLSWAQEAPWSMGGLASKRLRGQGKLDGSARKLRNLDDDDDDCPPVRISTEKKPNPDVFPSASASLKGNQKFKGQAMVDCKTRNADREEEAEVEDDLEEVESTPVRKLRRLKKSVDATLVSSQKNQNNLGVSSSVKKTNSLSKKNATPQVVVASCPRTRHGLRRGLVDEAEEDEEVSSTQKSNFKAIKSKNDSDTQRSVLQTRSAKRNSAIIDVKENVSSVLKKSARKVLLRDDEDEMISHDSPKKSVKAKGQTLRRSSRVGNVKSNSSPIHEPAESEEI